MGFYSSLFMGAAKATAGASMMTGNMVHNAVQNAQTNREVRKITQKASQTNFLERRVAVLPGLDKQQLLLISNDPSDNDVYDYDTRSITAGLDYIWGENDDPDGMVVSGGDNSARVWALSCFVRKAQTKGIPLIALHAGNRELESMIDSESVDCEHISRLASYYDVFRGLPSEDVTYLLYKTMPDDDAEPACEALLRALVEMVLLTQGTVTIERLAAYPLADLKDTLDGMLTRGEISADDHHMIDRYYMSGSAETNAVRIYLNDLARQADGLYGRMGTRTCNVKKMLNTKGAVSIDVGMANNDLIFSLVINHLLLLQSQGRDFALLLDNIPISRYPKVTDILRGRTYAISHSDFVSSLYGGEKKGEDLFAEIMGGVVTAVLYRHKGNSCQTWSDYLGKYHKIRIRYNISQSKGFLNSSDSRGVSVDETEEPRISAGTLGSLPQNVACVQNPSGILIAEIKS